MDEIDDFQALELRTRINGEVVQEGNTANMIFGVAETVAWLSRTLTLLPGDIIATGTPAGVGGPKGLFLRAGDNDRGQDPPTCAARADRTALPLS
jgi:2-keto-4-pentenoate hydratase/2-oxohepta-3-ene-1,7-dioic acid hydratase in catechol pathway